MVTVCLTKNFKFWTRHLCTPRNFCRALLRKDQEPRDSETKRLRSKETRVKEFKSARNSVIFCVPVAHTEGEKNGVACFCIGKSEKKRCGKRARRRRTFLRAAGENFEK